MGPTKYVCLNSYPIHYSSSICGFGSMANGGGGWTLTLFFILPQNIVVKIIMGEGYHRTWPFYKCIKTLHTICSKQICQWRGGGGGMCPLLLPPPPQSTIDKNQISLKPTIHDGRVSVAQRLSSTDPTLLFSFTVLQNAKKAGRTWLGGLFQICNCALIHWTYPILIRQICGLVGEGGGGSALER